MTRTTTEKSHVFADQHFRVWQPMWLLRLVYGLTLVAVCLRSYRSVNRFALSHWLISYDGGFVKRGLPGALLQLERLAVHFQTSIWLIAIYVTDTILALFLVAIYLIGWRIGKRNNLALFVYPILLVSALLTTSLRHTGYYDQIIFLLVLLIVLLMVRRRYVMVPALLATGLLIHENITVFYFPVVLMWILLVRIQKKNGCWQTGDFW